MKSYCVKWGVEEDTVYAESETDAWAQFCDGHDNARRSPRAFDRTIAEVVAKPEESTDESPRAGLSAEGAKDRISRMRSAEKLQEIINSDTRVSVVEAAKSRLAEIGE